MFETSADLASLQELLDRSAAAAGPHLSSIITAERRLSAGDLSSRLTGMRLLALATVTADGRPLVGPVDGVFYRGAFYFGSAPDSVRFRHIRRRPGVSATHVPGEELAVTVHGRAVMIDVGDKEQAGFRRALLDIYVPRYGAEWEEFLDHQTAHARIDAQRMYTFHMDPANMDAANMDAANMDAANMDAANMDAANMDAANMDAANMDAANMDRSQINPSS